MTLALINSSVQPTAAPPLRVSMLKSMTSYGQSMLSTKWGDLSCEIRSVNQRYLDVSVRIPDGLRPIDSKVRDMMSSRVSRGKVDIALNFTDTSDSREKLHINHGIIQQLSDAIGQVQTLQTGASSYDPMSVLQWPGVVSVQSALDEDVLNAALSTFEKALDDFLRTRTREGQQIAGMLEKRALQLTQLVAELRKHRPDVVARQRQKLLAKLAQLDIEHDAARLEQELVYTAQRLDIDEELDRMNAHLDELALVLERDEPVGRRLDFLMQEFNREANTIASKASDSATTAASIDMKVLIEQIREQVQNLE